MPGSGRGFVMRRPAILFLTSTLSPFVEDDLQMLKGHYPVREVITGGSPAGGPVQRSSLGLSIFLRVIQTDITFSWFAHNHSYLAVMASRLLGKKSVVVVGG
ncbi:MAG: glycosyl transferase family 1, partial [Methanomicrobiales archaeon]|nr:glycosyl transferase family 1 [Methanomicrobiales archaeon]